MHIKKSPGDKKKRSKARKKLRSNNKKSPVKCNETGCRNKAYTLSLAKFRPKSIRRFLNYSDCTSNKCNNCRYKILNNAMAKASNLGIEYGLQAYFEELYPIDAKNFKAVANFKFSSTRRKSRRSRRKSRRSRRKSRRSRRKSKRSRRKSRRSRRKSKRSRRKSKRSRRKSKRSRRKSRRSRRKSRSSRRKSRSSRRKSRSSRRKSRSSRRK